MGLLNGQNGWSDEIPFGESPATETTLEDGSTHYGMVGQPDYLTTNSPGPYKPTVTGDNGTGEASVSQYMAEHPGASYEEILAYMATQSDEWAEKYLDYLTERGELDRANQYTASREDTAYQRLVSDLKAAGFNPALMMGSSASPFAGASQGYVKVNEGANSRSISNYSKLKNLLLAYAKHAFEKSYKTANAIQDGAVDIMKLIVGILT